MLQEYPGRKFGLDLVPATKIVRPIIDKVLGQGTWCVGGGNFFETNTAYRVHADTGKDGPDKVWQTFVFPLRMEAKINVVPALGKIRLLILKQTWNGDAAFFLRGSADEPNEYNIVVKDYGTPRAYQPAGNIGHLDNAMTIDDILLEQCPHLEPSNFAGLS